MLKPVVQEETTGCGIASVANILGKTYSEMKAAASAILYSLVETAKANDLQPAVYLQALFKQLPHIRAADIDTLSPWNIKLN